jgi:hypothetical protein
MGVTRPISVRAGAGLVELCSDALDDIAQRVDNFLIV